MEIIAKLLTEIRTPMISEAKFIKETLHAFLASMLCS